MDEEQIPKEQEVEGEVFVNDEPVDPGTTIEEAQEIVDEDPFEEKPVVANTTETLEM